jgi:hypothetical protein
MPPIPRQTNAGGRLSLNAMPKHDSPLNALQTRKIVRAGMRSVKATSGSTPIM